MPFSINYQNKIASKVFLNTDFSSPTSLWLALFTGDPNTSANEVSSAGTGYQRISVTFQSTGVAGKVQNSTKLTFPQALAAWGTIVYAGIMDAQSGGSIVAYDYINVSQSNPNGVPQTIGINGQPYFDIGQLTFDVDLGA